MAGEAPLGKLRHISSPAGQVLTIVSPTRGTEGTPRTILQDISGSQQGSPTIYYLYSDIA